MEIHGNAKLKKIPRSVQFNSMRFNSVQNSCCHKSILVVAILSEHLTSDTQATTNHPP